MIILVGPSASGKTEVAKILGSKYQIKKVITHTTRPMRPGEVNGVDYHFVSVERFLLLKKENAFVETTFYNHNYYGTAKKDLAIDKVLIVDPNGLSAFQELHDPNIIAFFLDSTNETRYERMLSRGDSISEAKKRIANDAISFASDKLTNINYIIDSETQNLDQIAKQVYTLYFSHFEKK